jgi:hypothetical protein
MRFPAEKEINMRTLQPLLMAGILAAGTTVALAQSASSVGTGGASRSPTGSSGTIGSAGSAAAGGTSASTVGVGGTTTGPKGTASSIGSAGSAAAVDGKASTKSKTKANEDNLKSQANAKAKEPGGYSSKSKTKIKIKAGEMLSSKTKSDAHAPGSPAVKSNTSQSIDLSR